MSKVVMIKRMMQVGAIGLLGVGVASCGGSSNNSASTATTTTATTPAPALLENNFGGNFGVDYRMAANTTPVKPASGDIIALSLTTPAMALH